MPQGGRSKLWYCRGRRHDIISSVRNKKKIVITIVIHIKLQFSLFTGQNLAVLGFTCVGVNEEYIEVFCDMLLRWVF